MWIVYALFSAVFMGFYDVAKKQSLVNNSILPVLWLNTLFSSILLLPLVIFSAKGVIAQNSLFYVQQYGWQEYLYILAKSCMVLLSWFFGYLGLKHLPITIVSPINALRPVAILIAAMLVFGEKLSLLQWFGCILAVISFYMLSRVGKLENIHFKNNRWIHFILISNLLGVFCALYDKYLFADSASGGLGLCTITVLVWFMFFQCMMMSLLLFSLYFLNKNIFKDFQWRYSIVLISLAISAADFCYYYSLSKTGAMLSVIEMLRRSSVVVSFLVGALLFREKNIKKKSVEIIMIIVSILLLVLGTATK